MPYVLFGLVCLAWSGSFLLMKKAAPAFSPAAIGAWRVLLGALTLALLSYHGRRFVKPLRSQYPAMIVVTIAGCVWPYFIQPWVVQRHGSAVMALAVACLPLLTIVASIPILGQWPTLRQTIGVLGALVCMGVLLTEGRSRPVPIPMFDLVMAISVPTCYAVSNSSIRRWLADLPAMPMTCYTFAASAMLLGLATFHTPEVFATPVATTTLEPGAWRLAIGSLFVLGVLGTGLGTYWFNSLVREHGPLFAGMVTNLVPIGAVLLAWADGEPISREQLFALAGIFSMVLLVQYRGVKDVRSVKEEV